jgi:hypothetical protein
MPETLDLDYAKFVEAFQAATTANPETKPATKPAAAK